MHFLKALTAAIVGAIIVTSAASAEGLIGCESSKPTNSSVSASTCSIFNHEGTPASQAYASAHKGGVSRAYVATKGGYFVPVTDSGRRDPHKTGISGGAN